MLVDGQGWSLFHLEELGLSRDPEVFLIPLLLFLVSICLWAVLACSAPAAMATDEEEGEDHQRWKAQEDSQADGVEDALLMLGHDGVPDSAEEGADFLHGAWLVWGWMSLAAH